MEWEWELELEELEVEELEWELELEDPEASAECTQWKVSSTACRGVQPSNCLARFTSAPSSSNARATCA